jgi:transposase
MSKTRRTYTREFKLEVLRAQEHGKKVAELCRIYEISPTNINRWNRELQTNPEHAFSGNGNPYKENAKLAEYERLLGQAHAEIAFLKKTLSCLERRLAEQRKREGLR